MDYKITSTVKGEKVDFKNPVHAFYKAVGEEEGMQKLMYSFYDKIYESAIAHFFPQDEDEFNEIKVKNTKFFIQICGGPKVYEEEAKGVELNEFMVRIHDDFSIYEKSRVEWLGTMADALKELEGVDEALIKDFWDYLENFSKLTVNTYTDGSKYYANL